MLCEACEFAVCLLLFRILKKRKKATTKTPSCTNWWLILGKCIETAPGRHQEALPIWPWLLQCIQCCQESKSVITATQCMKHPRSFAFYFLYSHSTASPAAGCSFRAHKARATRHVRDGARCWDAPLWLQPPCSVPGWSSHPPTVSPPSAKATGTAQSWLLSETMLLKIQCQAGRQPVISSDPVTNHSLLRGSPMPTVHCRHMDPVPDENTTSKEHESIVTRIWDSELGDGPQPFQRDELPAALMKCKYVTYSTEHYKYWAEKGKHFHSHKGLQIKLGFIANSS